MTEIYKSQVPITEEILQTSVHEIGLSNRLASLISNAGIYTVQDLLYCCPLKINCNSCTENPQCTKFKLMSVKHVSEGSLQEIYNAFERKGWFTRV